MNDQHSSCEHTGSVGGQDLHGVTLEVVVTRLQAHHG